MLFKYVVAILLFGVWTVSHAEYGDMDPGTCAPSGIVNKAKEKFDPKTFWSRMYYESREAALRFSGQRPSESFSDIPFECSLRATPGTRAYHECVMTYENVLAYWVRCNRHAQRMCRMHGGSC